MHAFNTMEILKTSCECPWSSPKGPCDAISEPKIISRNRTTTMSNVNAAPLEKRTKVELLLPAETAWVLMVEHEDQGLGPWMHRPANYRWVSVHCRAMSRCTTLNSDCLLQTSRQVSAFFLEEEESKIPTGWLITGKKNPMAGAQIRITKLNICY